MSLYLIEFFIKAFYENFFDSNSCLSSLIIMGKDFSFAK